jgi:hypothetical protein
MYPLPKKFFTMEGTMKNHHKRQRSVAGNTSMKLAFEDQLRGVDQAGTIRFAREQLG